MDCFFFLIVIPSRISLCCFRQ